jgi:hypothetical protein
MRHDLSRETIQIADESEWIDHWQRELEQR